MANTVAIDVKINALEAATTLKDLKKNLKDAVNELAGLESGTEQFNKLASAVDDAKDRIEKLNKDIEQVGGAGKFGAIADFGSKIAAGFEIAQGAMALFGSESEAVEKALQKVQAAMALTQGLKDLSELGKAWDSLKSVATNALNAIKTGIGATGIGVLLLALGALVTYWDDIKAAVSGVSDEQESLNIKAKQGVDIAKGKLDATTRTENSLKLQGKTEREILQLKVAQTDQIIKATEIQLKQNINTIKAQLEAEKRNKEILEGILKFISAPITLVLKTVDMLGKALGKDWGLEDKFFGKVSELVFDPSKVAEDGIKTITETQKQLEELKNTRDGYVLQLRNLDKKEVTHTKEKVEEKKKIEKKLLEDMQMIQVEEVSSNQKRNDDILKSNFDFGQAQLEMLKAQSEKKKRLNESNYNEEYEIAKMQLDKILNDENKNNFAKLIAQEQFNAKVAELDEIERARKQKAADATLNITKGALQATADLVSAFAGKSKEAQKKAFEFQKGVNIANAVIDTFQSAVSAYKGSIGIPIVGPVLAPIAAATAVAAGIANIRKIEQTTFDSKESPSAGGGGGGGGSFAPNLSAPVGNTSTNLASIGFGQEQPEPVKVFVTETDISSSQKNVQKIEQKASIE